MERTVMSRFCLGVMLATLVPFVACTRDPQKLKLNYLASGDSYVAKKNYEEAIIQYRNAVTQDGSFGEARFKLAQMYFATGDAKNAYREYIRAADLMPNNIEAQLSAGGMRLAAGEYQDAKTSALAV